MDDARGSSSRSIRLTVLVLFLATGCSGLVYQVVWLRMLTTVFGVTAHAISTVLASFMAGLALGSFVFGRFVDRRPRPLRWYGLLEISIGLYGLCVPFLLWLGQWIFGALRPLLGTSMVGQGLVRAGLCFLVLVIPTSLMGATLPILCKFFVQTLRRAGRETGRLYFVNTLGGVLGCAATGFLLVPVLGLWTTTLIAAALNVGVGCVGLLLDARQRRILPGAAGSASSREPDPRAWRRKTLAQQAVLASFALSGFVALVFEVVWSRILILVFGSTVYSFSAMLTMFLLGLAVGGALFGWLADRVRDPLFLLAALLAAIPLVILAEIASINLLPDLFLDLLGLTGFDFAAVNLVKFALSLLIFFPAAVLFGGTFPVVSRLYTDSLARTGTSIGTVYAANTLGAILGSVAGGFVLLPLLGMRSSLMLIAALLLAGSSALFLIKPGRPYERFVPALALPAIFLVGAFLAPAWNTDLLALGVYFDARRYLGPDGEHDLSGVLRQTTNLYYAEGLNDTIIVNEMPQERVLTINGKIIATSSWEDQLHLRMLGHLPYLLHPGRPDSAINIGLGVGGTISGLASHDLAQVNVVELEPSVIPAARLFAESNDAVLDNPKLRVLIGDGRDHLAHTSTTYDIVSSDPFHPYMTGAGNLYSRQYLGIGRRRLNPGGVMSQWIPLHQLGDREFRSLVKTFGSVFPHFTVWFSGRSVILIGSEERLSIDPDLVRAKMEEPGARESLGQLGIDTPEKLLSFLLADERSLAGYADGVPLNTDDFPHVEYAAARRIYDSTTGSNLDGVLSHLLPAAQTLGYFAAETGGDGVDFERARRLIEARHAGARAIVLFHEGRYHESLDLLAGAVAESSDPFLSTWLAFTRERVGLLFQQAGNTALAISHYEASLRIQPDRVVPLSNLGHLYYFGGRHQEALALLERAFELQPTNVEIMLRLAMVRDALGQQALAERMYRLAIRAAPESADAPALFAVSRYQQGRLDEAAALFRQSLRNEPSKLESRLGLVEVLLRLGRTDEAHAECRRLLDRDPGSAAGHLLLGQLELRRSRPTAAKAALERAVEIDASNPESHFALARTNAALGEVIAAMRALDAAVRLGGEPYVERAAADPLLGSLRPRFVPGGE